MAQLVCLGGLFAGMPGPFGASPPKEFYVRDSDAARPGLDKRSGNVME
jgi:hypothetical protein